MKPASPHFPHNPAGIDVSHSLLTYHPLIMLLFFLFLKCPSCSRLRAFPLLVPPAKYTLPGTFARLAPLHQLGLNLEVELTALGDAI